MKTSAGILVGLVVGMFWIGPVFSQELIIFPKEGQSQDQVDKDKTECYTWAKGQTGFDPLQTSQAPAPASQAPQGERLRGAARGAALGAVVGEIASDDAGKGAAAGAAAGTMTGGMRVRDKNRAQAQKQAQAAAADSQQHDAYLRAYGACLEGKGYTVK